MRLTEAQPDIGIPDPADVLMLEAEAMNRQASLDEVYVKRGVTYALMRYSDGFTPPESILYAYRGIGERTTAFGVNLSVVLLEEVDE